MGRFVVAHQEERFVLGPVLEKLDGQISNDVGDVPVDDAPAGRFEKGRIDVRALSRQDRPVIEPGRVAAEVPFADHAGIVAGCLQILGDRWLRAVELVKHGRAVLVAVLAGQDRGAARRADRVNAEDPVKPHPVACQPVEVGRLVDLTAVRANGVRGVVVGHNEENIGALGGGAHTGDADPREGDHHSYEMTSTIVSHVPPIYLPCLARVSYGY